MDSALSFLLDALATHGLPVAVSAIIGFVLGYLFFRSRSEDERKSIEAIKEAREVTRQGLADTQRELESAREENAQLDRTIAELNADNARLASDLQSAQAQIAYWQSKAKGAVTPGHGPLDDALGFFAK